MNNIPYDIATITEKKNVYTDSYIAPSLEYTTRHYRSTQYKKNNYINELIEKSNFIYKLDNNYWFDWNFKIISNQTWENITNEIRKLLNEFWVEKFLTKDINISIKPWNNWDIDLYIRKKSLNMIINFKENIWDSIYSVSYLRNWKIEKHFWDYNINNTIFDINKFFITWLIEI